MVGTRSGRGRSAVRTGGRVTGRSTSRTATAVAAQRSGAPRARRGRGGGRGGGSARAASAPRGNSSDGEAGPSAELDALRQEIAELREALAARAGAAQQLQAEIDDIHLRLPADGGGAAGTDEPEVIISNMGPRPPRPPLSLHAQQLQLKEDLKAWRSPANTKRWVLTGERPLGASTSVNDMRAMLYGVIRVSP